MSFEQKCNPDWFDFPNIEIAGCLIQRDSEKKSRREEQGQDSDLSCLQGWCSQTVRCFLRCVLYHVYGTGRGSIRQLLPRCLVFCLFREFLPGTQKEWSVFESA